MGQHSTSGPITVSVNANGEISLTWPTSLDLGGAVISGLGQTDLTSMLDDFTPEALCEECAEILGIPESLARALCARVRAQGP